MIVVKIELWPFGDESRAKLLHVGHIWNTGQGDLVTGEYQASFHGKRGGGWRQGAVTGFKRQRRTAWELLYLALGNALEPREKK